jgi:hypothetical protein
VTMDATLAVRDQLPWRRRPQVHLAIALGHLIGRLRPRHIRRVLRACAGNARPASFADAEKARRMVVAGSLRCAGEGCVPRSIATALLCRFQGTWPTWHSGVRTDPFMAHAWVAVDGRPVGESPTVMHVRSLIVIPPGRAR